RQGVPPALQRGKRLLQRAPGRVRGPRVLVVALACPAHAVLRVGRGLVDRHDDRAGARVRLLPGVDGPGLEAEYGVVVDHAPRVRPTLENPATWDKSDASAGRARNQYPGGRPIGLRMKSRMAPGSRVSMMITSKAVLSRKVQCQTSYLIIWEIKVTVPIP